MSSLRGTLDPGRPRDRATPWVWALALVAPVTWFVHLNVSYLLVPSSCRAGHVWWLVATSIPAAAVIVGSMWLSWRAWHADRPDSDRVAGTLGFWMGALFLLVSSTILLSNVVVDPCAS